MKRLLCIVGSMNAGGAETFLMKVYRALDKTMYQMDFCVTKSGIYDEEIKKMGGKIYLTTPKTKGPIKSFNSIKQIVSNGKYEYVMRISQNSLSAIELFAAKQGGAGRTIYRSSNSQACGGAIESILHRLFMPLSKYIPDVKIAPSKEAAEFMFGKQCIEKGEAKILHNGIDIDEYTFNQDLRKSIRDELNINNKFVVGHVGRFNVQKNHQFLLKVFKKITEIEPEAVLVLVGDGELRNDIEQMCKLLNIEDKVIMTGVRNDIPAILSSFDVFVLPSLFEGLPNTVIEAQVNGLHCVISDTISKEARVTKLVTFNSLSDSLESWAKTVVSNQGADRITPKSELISNHYDIESCVHQFTKLVFDE